MPQPNHNPSKRISIAKEKCTRAKKWTKGPNIYPIIPREILNHVQVYQAKEEKPIVYVAVEHQGSNQQFLVL